MPAPALAEAAEHPLDTANPCRTHGHCPEGCRTSDIHYVDKNDPKAEVENAPAEDTMLTESSVPQAVPLVLTELPILEEELPLLVDSPTPQTYWLTVCEAPKLAVSKDIQKSLPPCLYWLSMHEVLRPEADED